MRACEGSLSLSLAYPPPFNGRSPWSNTYTPPLDDGTLPSDKLRELEVAMNNSFDSYREMYFEGGVSSVYLWDLEDVGFAGVVLMKKGQLEITTGLGGSSLKTTVLLQNFPLTLPTTVHGTRSMSLKPENEVGPRGIL